MKAVIIDDEYNGVLVLRQKLKDYCPTIEVVAEAENGRDGLDVIRKFKPELVFFDIEMPEMGGFEMLIALQEKKFHLIFTTAYDHYAIKAIKYSAFDYLLKPIDIDELKATIERLHQTPVTEVANMKLETLEQNLLTKPYLNKLAIPTLDGLSFFDIQHIVRLEADGNYTHIYFDDQHVVMASRTLKEFQDILPGETFFRLHNSHLVNLNFIKRYIRGDGGQVELKNGDFVMVSRRKKDEFLSIFGK